jgi:hypothetical protein
MKQAIAREVEGIDLDLHLLPETDEADVAIGEAQTVAGRTMRPTLRPESGDIYASPAKTR